MKNKQRNFIFPNHRGQFLFLHHIDKWELERNPKDSRKHLQIVSKLKKNCSFASKNLLQNIHNVEYLNFNLKTSRIDSRFLNMCS